MFSDGQRKALRYIVPPFLKIVDLTMRWRKHIFIVVVSCCQLSLLIILIYLIKFCNKNQNINSRTAVVDQEKPLERAWKDRGGYLSNMAGTAYSKMMSSFLRQAPTTSTTPMTVLNNNVNNKGFYKFGRGNHTSLSTWKHSGNKTRLKLIVAVLSAPIRFDRREGIRRTWMNQCNSEEVVCRFFTDSLSDMDPKVQSVLANESAKYGDLEFMPVPKGYNFGLRLLWLMEWSVERYEFDFFLRMDDDYFVCLKRLLFEIPFRPQKRLYWGYVHCEVEGLVRVDEGFLILSADLVLEFMSKKNGLLCHPFGDQTIAIWINDVKNVIYFHDPRIYHDVTAHIPEFKLIREVCGTYISLHGSYLHEMLIYWNAASKDNHSTYWVPSIQPISNICPLSTRFDWRAMGGPPYGWEPKPCVLKPLWNLGSMHRGRNMM